MQTQTNTFTIKQVGLNGQVSLGREYAGKHIQMSKLEDGSLIIKPGKFIPSSEEWLFKGDNMEKVDRAINWAESNPRRDNFEKITNQIENDQD